MKRRWIAVTLTLLLGAALALNAQTVCSTQQGGPACAGGALGNVCTNLSFVASTTAGVTYNIYRGTTAGGENLTIPLASGLTATFYQDNAVSPGTKYYYVAAAAAGGQTSAASNEACAQTPNLPGAPASLVANPR